MFYFILSSKCHHIDGVYFFCCVPFCIFSVLLEIQTRLQDFSSFSTGLLADLEISEQSQNKVRKVFFFKIMRFLFVKNLSPCLTFGIFLFRFGCCSFLINWEVYFTLKRKQCNETPCFCLPQTLDTFLFTLQSKRAGEEPGIAPRDKDHMVFRCVSLCVL